MDPAVLKAFLGWCTVMNMGLLLFWFAVIAFARDWVYAVHSRWFKISEAQFDVIHYQGISYFKILIFILNVVPYFSLVMIS